VHVPFPLLHARQGVLQLSAQQWPSTQRPVTHSEFDVHPPLVCLSLQAPSASQIRVPSQLSSSSLRTTVVQVPFALSHERHAALQAPLQQRPSTQ
jgi:hypothetical protein